MPEPVTGKEKVGPEPTKFPEASKTRMAAKDWISLSISTLALAISGLTAFFNLVRQTDDLSVVVDAIPFVDAEWSEEPGVIGFGVHDYLRLLFINSGNRPSAVRNIRVSIGELTCTGRFFDTEFEPVVIKEKELVAVKTKLKKPDVFDTDVKLTDRGFLTFNMKALKSDFYDLRMCAHLTVATPSTGFETTAIEIFRQTSDRKLDVDLSEQRTVIPHVVWRKSGNIFSN